MLTIIVVNPFHGLILLRLPTLCLVRNRPFSQKTLFIPIFENEQTFQQKFRNLPV